MELRFGITMRITNADGYDETRDTIAHDWSTFFSNAFPESKYLFIPNIGNKAIDFIRKWDINVLIISGGDDIGATPLRDVTETALLEYAIEFNVPVVAVCRGLQLVHTYFGGKLINGGKIFVEKHRASQHDILIECVIRAVNSYHTNMIDENTLNQEFNILARCTEDNTIEAIKIKNILGIMWHPERDKDFSIWNKILIEDFIKDKYEN